MATAQMQRSSVSAVVFPNKISTEQQSLVLVKRLLAVAVSCITYLRGIFPECAYGTRYLDDLCVKILREDKTCPGSSQLVKWMLGCYDALQKKYLRMIVLAVYTHPEDPQEEHTPTAETSLTGRRVFEPESSLNKYSPTIWTVTECYQFKFKYTNSGPVMDFTSKNKGNDSNITCADTKKASILLIRKIYVLMQNLGPLPSDVCLTMKLFYYDEVTPPDYQPPGFKEGDCEGMIFEGEPMYLNVGEVPTPFHMLKVKVTTERERMENIDKTILKQGDTKVPLQAVRWDKDGPGEWNRHTNEDFVTDNKVEDQKKANRHLDVEELSLTCEEDENMKAGESQSPSVSNSQVDHLVNKTSELNMTEGKTRSGKIFHNSTVCENQAREHCKTHSAAAKCSKEIQKRNRSESEKLVHQFELSSSQDALPKRRKFSEPKEQF